MIGERDDGGAHPEYHRRMDLAVGVGGDVRFGQIVRLHGDHGRLFLLRVYVFDEALHQQVRPRELLLVG